MLKGHLNYFAVPGNDKSLWRFYNEVRWRWLKSRKTQPEGVYEL
jgi:RNA-directed DNA polymerase